MPKKSHDTLIRESTLLTTKLIDQITNSVEVFRPSASLYALTQLNQEENVNISAVKQPTEIDLVISGGGLKGYFACGAAAVLEQHLLNNNMRIARISGASAGAWSALFMLCGISTDVWIESYHWSAENMHRTIHDVYENVIVSSNESYSSKSVFDL
jgi:predicted acylesterase/phospholipase RssA